MLAKRTSKNQITLPKSVVGQFKDVDYFDVTAENGVIILKPVRTHEAEKVRARLAELGIKESDVDYAVQQARNAGPRKTGK